MGFVSYQSTYCFMPLPSIAAPVAYSQTPFFFMLGQQQTITDILAHPYKHFYEIAPRPHIERMVQHVLAHAPDFSLSLSTQSAYHNGMAHMLTQSLQRRFGLCDQKAAHVETCLQEALSNAIIHGNLEMQGLLTSLDSFERYYETVAQRVTLAPYSERRIHIMVWNHERSLELAVTDEGTGFDTLPDMNRTPSPHQKSGRGLQLIQSLASRARIAADRHTLCMDFNYREPHYVSIER